jgi:hypothetical protein
MPAEGKDHLPLKTGKAGGCFQGYKDEEGTKELSKEGHYELSRGKERKAR